jgi:hypothetical protein
MRGADSVSSTGMPRPATVEVLGNKNGGVRLGDVTDVSVPHHTVAQQNPWRCKTFARKDGTKDRCKLQKPEYMAG